VQPTQLTQPTQPTTQAATQPRTFVPLVSTSAINSPIDSLTARYI
jgi:hypothetical protein